MFYSSKVSELNDNLNLINSISQHVKMVITGGKGADSSPWNNKECKSVKITMRNKFEICTDEEFSPEMVKR